MRHHWQAAVAAVVFSLPSVTTLAADVTAPLYAPFGAPVIYRDWSGFYIGGKIGGAWATGTLTDNFTGANFTSSASGFVGGGTFGVNWEVIPKYVLGLEGSIDGAALGRTSNTVGVTVNSVPNTVQGSTKTNWVSTVAARFGIAQYNLLFYGKAGGGWADTNVSMNNLTAATAANASNTVGGWLLGAGIEYGLTYNWTIKVEYDFLGLINWNAASPLLPGDSFSISRDISMFTIGANYRF